MKANLNCEIEITGLEGPMNCENDKYSAQVQRLYSRHLRRNPASTGNINISLSTDKAGNIISVKVDTNIKSENFLKRLHAFSKIYKYSEIIMFNKSIYYSFSRIE
jgi:hypothetical protein